MDNTLKQGLILTGATLCLGAVAYRRLDEGRDERRHDWIGPIALILAALTASQAAKCFQTAVQDYWQLRRANQYPQLSQGNT